MSARRVAALYDIHGNLPALEAVLAEVDEADIDLVVCGGDVSAGPMPGAVLDLLRARGDGVAWIRGNADRGLVDLARGEATRGNMPELWFERARWSASALSEEQVAFLDGLGERVTCEIEGLGSVLFCHGSPRSDDEILTRITGDERLEEILADVDHDVVVCGHTHVQFDRTWQGVRIVNAGSVGMPYEGRPGAYWALLGPGVEHRRTVYDLDDAAERMRESGYPGSDEHLRELREPRGAEDVTAFFERQARGKGV